MRVHLLKSGVAIAAALMAAGCAVTQQDVNDSYDAAHRTISDALGKGPAPMALVEDVPTAFLGDRLVPLAYEATLPAVFRDKTVTLPANLGIKQIATLISTATGYPVHLSPDVFVPRDSLVPGQTESKGQINAARTEEPVYRQAFSGKAGMYMRNMTTDLGLDWSFDGSTINVNRFVTRMYQIAAIPGKVSIKSTMSKGMDTSTGNQSGNGGGGSSGGNTGSFSAQTSTGREGDFDQIAAITAEIEKLKSPMGRVSVNPQSRLVMVYDTKEAADNIGKLLKHENAISTRQVAITVRTLQIALNKGSQAGVNADLVFNAMHAGLARYAISFTSPTSLATGGGAVGVSVLRPDAPFSGTNAVVNALNQYGRTVQDNTMTKMTLNGLPVSVASFKSDDYLRSTTPSSGSLTATSGGVPGLTPGTITTGDFVNVLPAVNDHNQIVLAYWADSSKLNGPFTSAGAGSGQTQQQIQLAHTVGTKDDQTIALSDGQTVVLYGAITDQADSTTNTGIAGLTGSWNKSKTFQVIMLKATVVPSM
ncbi:secretin N-terminal domain-containing protein [Burkholderia multivorans]|uniref:Type II secretory pathway protein n=1 Tax=Burkholderia multivorans TaxID=87883 RepID=A0AB37ANC9_9BURK|nr:secretin N-terminal domain-containing protein [Burkholderia multivorans]MBU9589458.1 type II secretory pathway protein [Burkholderia multivorans]PRE41299.1 type II secretory pathway protein [Burkholderia multivorans]PRE54532.1 type II secretory pathway protein [Burkholderia multivorans]